MNSVKQTLETVLGSDNIVIDVQQLSTDDFGNVAFLAPNPAARDYDLNFDGWVGLPGSINLSRSLQCWNWLLSQDFWSWCQKKTKSSLRVWGSIPIHNSWKKQMLRTKMLLSVMKKYAEAQAWMIDNSLVMSAMSNGGTASVTKVTPFTRAYSLVGIKGDGNNYKYMKLQKRPCYQETIWRSQG